MSDQEGTFWYCMTHRRVEPYHGCRNSDRVGPFDTEQDAANALQTIADRERRYEEAESSADDD